MTRSSLKAQPNFFFTSRTYWLFNFITTKLQKPANLINEKKIYFIDLTLDKRIKPEEFFANWEQPCPMSNPLQFYRRTLSWSSSSWTPFLRSEVPAFPRPRRPSEQGRARPEGPKGSSGFWPRGRRVSGCRRTGDRLTGSCRAKGRINLYGEKYLAF